MSDNLFKDPLVRYVRRGAEIYRQEGLRELLPLAFAKMYVRIRPVLPAKGHVEKNDVVVPIKRRYGDGVVPRGAQWARARDRPKYDSGLVDSIRTHVNEGDTVVIVGGGLGVTTTVAARNVGDDGHVITYEAAADAAELVSQTVRLNGVSDRVSVNHAVVAREGRFLNPGTSSRGGAPQVSVDQLPDCDALVVDCDGPQVEILSNLPFRPRVVVVMTIATYDATEEEITELLRSRSYEIVARDIGDEGAMDFCRENGVYAITALDELTTTDT